jgi:hypothetical protein
MFLNTTTRTFFDPWLYPGRFLKGLPYGIKA